MTTQKQLLSIGVNLTHPTSSFAFRKESASLPLLEASEVVQTMISTGGKTLQQGVIWVVKICLRQLEAVALH